MKATARALFAAGLGLGGLLVYMLISEERYIYFPVRQLLQTPADAGLVFEEQRFRSRDGVPLHGWYMPAAGSRFTVLHLHGNAGNISHRLSLFRQWHDLGLSVFAFDYRGYGKSGGKPDEQGLYEDAGAAWDTLTAMGDGNEIILAGRSLGAAVATRLAREVDAAGLVLETPFTSMRDMVAHHYPLLPLGRLLRSRYDSEAMIADVQTPLLLISAGHDRIVPAGMAERIFAAANEPKLHRRLAGGHNDFDLLSEREYRRAWQQWLAGLSGRRSEP